MKTERIFVDTNVFLRYLTNEVPAQADAIQHLLQRAADDEIALVTNSLVIAEIVWALESFYRLARGDIRDRILAILNTPGLEVVDGDMILQAVSAYVEKGVDFIDALNAAWMLAHGLRQACTFDLRRFARFEGLSVHVPGE